ncbi:MAG: Gx transporter family protein [Tissierellia bacterium]|nr:Gx transporter family protein [Tissierellia bacterium]
MKNNRKFIFLSLFSTLGIILGLFESMIPIPIPLPGARLGLSNIVVLVTIVILGPWEGIFVTVFKTVILMLMTGAVSSFFFSLGGAILSSLGMILSYRYLSKYLSLIGISEIGAFLHHTGQVLVASFFLQSTIIISYLPILTILGLFTGYFVGLSSIFIIKNLKNSNILKDL